MARVLPGPRSSPVLLNVGSGIYSIGDQRWTEVSLDLFVSPLRGQFLSVCGKGEELPFGSAAFGAIVCVGEVLGYSDPSAMLRQFRRVIEKDGVLILDYRSTLSPRFWFKDTFGRMADLVWDEYNGSSERTWVYSPSYVSGLLRDSNFAIQNISSVHRTSAIIRRCGFSSNLAVSIEQTLSIPLVPKRLGDLILVAARAS